MMNVHELLIFSLAALVLVLSPGPNMLYLLSRSITQGKKAGIISLLGVISGFLFHIILVSFGLTAMLFAIPLAYEIVQYIGVAYLLYLAVMAVSSKGNNPFNTNKNQVEESNRKLFFTGFVTNVLNPKVAVFYLSLFPQFIHPNNGSVLLQSLQLGLTQLTISAGINLLIVLSAAKLASFFAKNATWLLIQKWCMAFVLFGLAIKMAFSRRVY